MQDVEQAEDFAHPAAYDRQRWAWGVGLTCAFDLYEGEGAAAELLLRRDAPPTLVVLPGRILASEPSAQEEAQQTEPWQD